MATPKKKIKKWDSEETKRLIMDTVSDIMKESGYSDLEVMKITRRMGKSKGVIGYHFENLNELLKVYIQQRDYWPPLFARFNFTEQPEEAVIRQTMIELMQDNLRLFKERPEMQKIILWQISESKPMLRSISENREAEGAKVFKFVEPYFIRSGVNFKAVIALLLGGSYYMALHAASNKSTVCGIDLNWEHDMDEVLRTISQIISWAWEKAQDRKAS